MKQYTCANRLFGSELFLSYYPLKQGLKRYDNDVKANPPTQFLSYYPLKQGLKQDAKSVFASGGSLFLSYYPLKQGLKQKVFSPKD